MTQGDTDETLRGSREATLGADGLNVSKASGTVPATAPDDSRPSAYANSEARTEGEAFNASREASLGGEVTATRAAGELVPEDPSLTQGAAPGDPDPERNWADEAGSD